MYHLAWTLGVQNWFPVHLQEVDCAGAVKWSEQRAVSEAVYLWRAEVVDSVTTTVRSLLQLSETTQKTVASLNFLVQSQSSYHLSMSSSLLRRRRIRFAVFSFHLR